MRGTWSTGLKPFGVPLKINWTFLLWPLLVWSFGWPEGLEVIIILTISLLFHEYAHVLAARYVGIMASDVTVFIFGGAARIQNFTTYPSKEAFIAVVGPISSFLLAFVLYMIVKIFSIQLWILSYAILINIVLAIFNLLPLFPMDGGRIFRAALSYKLGHDKGSLMAVWTTTILGSIISLISLYIGWWTLPIILTLVILMAWGEYKQHKQI